MPPERLTSLTCEAGLRDLTQIRPRLAHRDELIFRAVERLAALADETDNLAELLGETISRTIGLHLIGAYGNETSLASAPPIFPANIARILQDYIDAHLCDKVTLDDLARVAGESVHRLLIGFRQHFSTTPAQYIIQQRLRRSRGLLQHTTRPISEIAYAVGFSSQSHLTDLFKKHYGLTPNAFRNTSRSA